MKTLIRTLMVLALVSAVLSAAAAPPAPAPSDDELLDSPAAEAGAADAATGDVAAADAAAAEPDEAEADAAPFTRPTVAGVATAIRALSSGAGQDQVMRIANTLGWDLRQQRNVDNFFDQMRTYDRGVLQRGTSVTTKRVLEFARRTPYARKAGAHFAIMYPRTVSVTVQGKTASKPFEEVYPVDEILNAADTAFRKTAELLVMNQFMNWAGQVRGKIYLIADPADWNVIRRTGMANTPVQIVLTEDDTREFFVYANPAVREMLDAAVAFAVSELVLKEYSMAMGRQQRQRLPVFYLTGLAAEVAGLNAVITEQGPQQVKNWKGRAVNPRDVLQLHRHFREGKVMVGHLPLSDRQLNAFDRVVGLTSYPRDDEQIFYHLIQSRALVKYLHENGALPFVVFSKELAAGKTVERAFDNDYVKTRTDLSGGSSAAAAPAREERPRATRESRERRAAPDAPSVKPDDVLKSYRQLRSNAKDAIFMPLTKELAAAESTQP